MKTLLLTLLVVILPAAGIGQSTTKYFNNEYLEKEVPIERGKYSKITTTNSDGTTTTAVKNIKKDKIVRSETYKEHEPYGIWIYQTGTGVDSLDYHFDLVYSNDACTDTIAGLSGADYLEDNERLNYTAPKLAGEAKSIIQFMVKETIYPAFARDNDIQGKVILAISISATGDLEKVVVIRSAEIHLDKEAVRVIRKVKFTSGAILNGEKKRVCFLFPFVFKLQ